MRIIFMGTPQIAAKALEGLIDAGHEIVAVVTQSDKPQGRSSRLIPSPVKQLTSIRLPHVPLFQPARARDPHLLEQLRSLGADLGIVAAYGQILPQALLELPRLGCINIHYSLLPKLRGAAPIQRAILEGHTQTGVTIMRMVQALDAGAILAQQALPLSGSITAGELAQELTEAALPLLLGLLKRLDASYLGQEQDETQVSFAAKIESEDASIDWRTEANCLQRLIRAMDPDPGAWCYMLLKGQRRRVKLFDPRIESLALPLAPPGSVLHQGKKLVICATGAALSLGRVQPEGKAAMSAAAFLAGYRPGEICTLDSASSGS